VIGPQPVEGFWKNGRFQRGGGVDERGRHGVIRGSLLFKWTICGSIFCGRESFRDRRNFPQCPTKAGRG
jgi:hypothetical protein